MSDSAAAVDAVAWVDDLDVQGCADALVASVAEQRRFGARRFALVAHFADQHPPMDASGRDGAAKVRRWAAAVDAPELQEVVSPRTRLSDSRYVGLQLGADGTPLVSEFCVVELGLYLQTTTTSAICLLRDVLEIRHRLPRLWAAVMAGEVEDWRAREAATLTRVLTFEQARGVDVEVLDALTGLPFGRAVDVIEGRVIAADPEAHEARRRAEAEKRYVALGRRPNPAGLRILVAQGTVGDMARLDAMVAHVADLLGRAGDEDPLQVRRAKALAVLADPAHACLLLARHAHDDGQVPEQPEPDAEPDTEPETLTEPEPETTEYSPVLAARAFGEALQSLGPKVVARLRPRTVIYCHLAEEALAGTAGTSPGTQVARTNLGPAGLTQLREWLGHDHVVVKPVIDVNGQISVDDYEIPTHLAEVIALREPYEVFPFGTLGSSQSDNDHTRPYIPMDEGGPPGQTSTDNLGPLGRRHHRAKTFGGFTCYQPLPGLYLWRTPAGHWYRVDHTGSHHLGRETPEILRHTGDRPGLASRVELAWFDGLEVDLTA